MCVFRRSTEIAPLALTMGDPAGIGGELTLRAWRLRARDYPFFSLDCPQRLQRLAEHLKLDVPIVVITTPDKAKNVCPDALPVLPVTLSQDVVFGKGNPANSRAVLSSIEKAVTLTQQGKASAVVTNPINKAVLREAGFQHPGHTEYLADLAKCKKPSIMMLACDWLRVVPVTTHVSLQEAIKTLDADAIEHCIRTTHQSLQNHFAIAQPRIAVSGLNPHAGEQGVMGQEETTFIAPLLESLRREGFRILGPLAADTMFHARARAHYDVAICMYHDQALIPIKTLAFDEGVNITLGLPFVRTSPDHGTAYDIAGKGLAREGSFLAAMDMARQMACAGLLQ